MYKIGICDDDLHFCEEFERQVGGVFEQLGEKTKFFLWSSLNEAKGTLEQGLTVELLFLDIELECQLGMDLGRFLRQELVDYQTQIVYVSHEQGYVMELFDSEPLGFLIKPVTQDALQDVCRRFLQRDLRSKKKKEQKFYYKDGLETKVLSFDETIYFQSRGHKIVACTKEGTKEFYGKLAELEMQAPSYFIRIHKSYLVNTHFVQSYHPGKVVLNNQEELVISRSYKEAVHDFVLKRLEEM